MELRVLRYFLAVVQEENISRAAEALHVTQPTLSRQMRELEEELGTQLFERGKYLRLTDAGITLRRYAEEVVSLMDKIEGEFREKEEISGIISIGSGGLGALAFLAKTMDDFRMSHPRVRYELYTNSADYVKERLDRGLLDFALLMEPIDVSKYDYLRMPEKERWGLLMRSDHPLAGKERIVKSELADVPLSLPSRLSLQSEMAGWFGDMFQNLNVYARHNLINGAAALARQGNLCVLTIEGAANAHGCASVGAGTGRAALAPTDMCSEEQLVFRPLWPELSLTAVLAWKKFLPTASAAGKFLEYVKTIHFEHTLL